MSTGTQLTATAKIDRLRAATESLDATADVRELNRLAAKHSLHADAMLLERQLLCEQLLAAERQLEHARCDLARLPAVDAGVVVVIPTAAAPALSSSGEAAAAKLLAPGEFTGAHSRAVMELERELKAKSAERERLEAEIRDQEELRKRQLSEHVELRARIEEKQPISKEAVKLALYHSIGVHLDCEIQEPADGKTEGSITIKRIHMEDPYKGEGNAIEVCPTDDVIALREHAWSII